ncbi:phosphoribosyl-ATP diphosphatase [Sphingoaurantiacus capsulatus]|uniref:Phosphoribosyl-ATP pyrophosphatase n=1 Tax=Sphingoaurantiacus capsulatus TaxID=1771310 RepID=A0ABV7XDV3_9SPHN
MTLTELYAIIEARRGDDPATSYVAKSFAKGRAKLAQKVGEEAVETVIAAIEGDRDAIISESADLIFHLLMLWSDAGIAPADVTAALEKRRGTSGLEEKANRKEPG